MPDLDLDAVVDRYQAACDVQRDEAADVVSRLTTAYASAADIPVLVAEVRRLRERHDPRCLTLTDSENNVYCDCRTLATIDGSKAATERAERAEQALERVRAAMEATNEVIFVGRIKHRALTLADLHRAIDGDGGGDG